MTAPTDLDGADERPPRTSHSPEVTEPPSAAEPGTRADTLTEEDNDSRASQRRSWYREPALWVSATAVLVSVVALVLSQASSATDRQFQERTRLTTVLQQLVDIQIASERAQSQAAGTGTVPPQSTAQVRFLVDEAYQLSQRVPATTYEKLQIAIVYQTVYDLDKALVTAREAMQQAQGPIEKITAGRSTAMLLFIVSDVDGGRQLLTEALEEAWSGQPALAPYVRTQVIFETEGFWSGAELQLGNCTESREHLDRARATLTGLPPGMAGMSSPRLEQLAGAVANCRPPG